MSADYSFHLARMPRDVDEATRAFAARDWQRAADIFFASPPPLCSPGRMRRGKSRRLPQRNTLPKLALAQREPRF